MLGGFTIVSCSSCLLTRRVSSERAGEKSSSRQAITPARYDERTLAKKHNAATGERGDTIA